MPVLLTVQDDAPASDVGEDGGGGGDARAQQAKKKNKMDTTS